MLHPSATESCTQILSHLIRSVMHITSMGLLLVCFGKMLFPPTTALFNPFGMRVRASVIGSLFKM